MKLESLPPVILAIAEQRELNSVLKTIVDTVARQPDVALARIWLRDRDESCPLCSSRELAEGTHLHLRASGGSPQKTGKDWSRIDGEFHKISLPGSELKIAHIATTGNPIRIRNLAVDREWMRHPEWPQGERLVSFAGHPMIFRGEIQGVLAVFRRSEASDACFSWLQTMASAAAVAIANARAFETNESLRFRLEQERDYLREEVETSGAFGEILGRSAALQRVLRQVEMVATTEASVLIMGESGTGKELIARAIHQRSLRGQKSLVKVNCGSIPRELFESEFFGHVRGSFTGAIRDRIGRFQLADGGTLFLDEIGEIPLELQSKLLRVLQEGEFERIGDDATRRVNVRVIAATNHDLNTEVDQGRFRLDLYYRLGVFPMEVPPLRERREDIPELLAHFVRQACVRCHLPAKRIARQEVERAQDYDWPGNVRELQNVVERAVIVSPEGRLSLDLPRRPASSVRGEAIRLPPRSTSIPVETPVIPEEEWCRRERENILAALRQAGFRISGIGGAAELLGIHPATLTSRMKAFGIDKRNSGPGGQASRRTVSA